MFGAGGPPAYAPTAPSPSSGDAPLPAKALSRRPPAPFSRLGEEKKRKRAASSKETAHVENQNKPSRGKDADDAGSDSIMTGQPGPSEGAPEVSAREKGSNAEGVFCGTVPKKSRSGRLREKKEEGGPKKDQSAADILVSIANA